MPINPYDVKINELIRQYCIDFNIKDRSAFLSTEKHISLLCNHTITTYIGENNYALWGAGLHTHILMKSDLIDKSKIVCIIDNDSELWGDEISGIPIKSPDALIECDINRVFINISNNTICNAITKQINSIKADINIFTIEKSRTHLKNNYWSVHFDIFKLCYSFDHETSIAKKKHLAEKIIVSYLNIRDFINAIKFIDIYIARFENPNNYIALKNELSILLDEVRANLKRRDTNDVLILLYDNLRAGEIYGNTQDMPYCNSLVNEGISYSRAYSPGLHTSDSLMCTFLNKTCYDYYASKDNTPKATLINDFQNITKNIKLYTSLYINGLLKKQLNVSDDIIATCTKYNTTSEIFWSALTDLCNDTQISLKYLHFIKETHLPCFCGAHNTDTKDFGFIEYTMPDDEFFACNFSSPTHKQETFNMRHAEALRYVDSQTEFYLSMLSSSAIKIILADHSRFLQGIFLNNSKKNHLIHSNSFHVPIIIHGGEIKHDVITDVFSTAYFGEIISKISQKVKLTNNNLNIAEVGFSGYYNFKRKKTALLQGDQYAANGFYLAIDEKYKLVIDSANELHYFAMDNEEEEIFEEEVQKIIHDRLYKYVEKWRNK